MTNQYAGARDDLADRSNSAIEASRQALFDSRWMSIPIRS